MLARRTVRRTILAPSRLSLRVSRRHPGLLVPKLASEETAVEAVPLAIQEVEQEQAVPTPHFVWLENAHPAEPVQVVNDHCNSDASELVLLPGLQGWCPAAEPYLRRKDAKGYVHERTPLAVVRLRNGTRGLVGEVGWPGDRIVTHGDVKRMLRRYWVIIERFWEHVGNHSACPRRFWLGGGIA